MSEPQLRTTDHEFAEHKLQLIRTVIWYRDKMHGSDTIHTQLISRIRGTDDILTLHDCEATVASWAENL